MVRTATKFGHCHGCADQKAPMTEIWRVLGAGCWLDTVNHWARSRSVIQISYKFSVSKFTVSFALVTSLPWRVKLPSSYARIDSHIKQILQNCTVRHATAATLSQKDWLMLFDANWNPRMKKLMAGARHELNCDSKSVVPQLLRSQTHREAGLNR